MKTENLKTIKIVAKKAGKLLSYGALLALSSKIGEATFDIVDRELNSDYDSALDAILKGLCFSSSKHEAVLALNKNGSKEYYKAVYKIATNQDMFDSSKVKLIKELSK